MALQFNHKSHGSLIGSGTYQFRHYGDETPPEPDTLILYDNGDQCTSVTGGWVGCRDTLYPNKSGTTTFNTSSIDIYYNYYQYARTVNAINITNYKTLHAIVQNPTSYSQNGDVCTLEALDGNGNANGRSSSVDIPTGSSYREVTVDISSLTDSHWVAIVGQYYLQDWCHIYCTKVWLTKT